MNSLTNTPEQQSQFLEAMATQYSFTGDTRTVFLARFNQVDLSKDNTVLAGFITWSRKPEDGAQKVQDELKKICDVLEQDGCPIDKLTKKGRQPKGKSPWKQACNWLWSIKFSEWQEKQNLGNISSINEYLEKEIKPKPDETIFDEKEITFRDLYVPLKVELLDDESSIKLLEVLEEWAKKMLDDEQKEKKVLFIQGDAGRGKSVFCRIFADWIRQNLYPYLTPIVIKLRHLKVLENNLTKTL